MAHQHNQNSRDALLYWLNSAFRQGKEEVGSLSALADGIILLEVLQTLDPDAIESTPDNSDSARNLLQVRKGLLSSFHRDSNEGLELQATRLDTHAVTQKKDLNEIAEFILLLVCLAVTGPKLETYIAHINTLATENPNAFSTIGALVGARMSITASKDGDQDEAGVAVSGPTAGNSEASDGDRILSLEAALAKSRADLDKVCRDYTDTRSRLESLQQRQTELLADVEQLQQENQELRVSETRGTADAQLIRDLKYRNIEQDATIQSLEDQLQTLEESHVKLSKEAGPLRDKAERARELEDEVQELRYQNAELEKKSNVAENYKKKILQQRELQIEVAALKSANQDLHRKMDEQDEQLKELPRLQEVELRYHNMLRSYESQIADMNDHKKGLESCIRDADRRAERLEAQRIHDEKLIIELREQLHIAHETVARGGGSHGLDVDGPSLGEELGGSDNFDAAANASMELLKAENQLLKANLAGSGDLTRLRVELEAAEGAKSQAQQRYNDLFEKYVIAQEQINALVNNATGEGLVKAMDIVSDRGRLHVLTTAFSSSVVFAKMRREKEDAVLKVAQLEQECQKLRAQIADYEREVLSARAECKFVLDVDFGNANILDVATAASLDTISALEKLKETDQLIAASARSELAVTQQKLSDLQADYQIQQNELVKAFLTKERLAQELEETRDTLVQQNSKPAIEKQDKLRERIKTLTESLDKSEQEKYELQRTIKVLQDGSGAMMQKRLQDQLIMNLMRENSLIASAWYDYNSRMNSNYVVLQKRSEAPKAWINKARQKVNDTPRR